MRRLNLLDSHDTARFITIARGDMTALRMAMFTHVLFTRRTNDLLRRRNRDGRSVAIPIAAAAMIWEPSTRGRAMIDYTKRLTTLRKKYVPLRRGTMTNLYAKWKVFAFARQLENETVIVAVNAWREPVMLDLRVDPLLPNNVTLIEPWTNEQVIVREGFARGIEIVRM